MKSLICLVIAYTVLLATHFFFYPKWDQSKTEATLSWDVSGYYMYLPALFIYGDIKECSFQEEILNKYQPTPDFQQAFKHESGNYVMKYSAGLAIQYSPFFFIAHTWAKASPDYPADGFSFPYQFMISMGSLLIALLGLFFLRKILLYYFEDLVAGLTLLGLVVGTNYLNYSAIDGAMSHNWLFTIYAILIYLTIHFYRSPGSWKAVGLGLLVGLAALSRPTEVISCIIPLFWGVNLLSGDAVRRRFYFFSKRFDLVIIALCSAILIGSIQLIYWKYVSGDWIVYSYEDQGFSWLNPHLMDGMFSYKSGWLVYSPLLLFALLGFFPLFKRKRALFTVCLLFMAIYVYMTFAWDEWWYGGSLGQRAMVQSYPVLMIPFAAFLSELKSGRFHYKFPLALIMVVACYLNLWFTRQAHRGGMLHVGQMTGPYFWKILGRYDRTESDLKLLDTEEAYFGLRHNVRTVYFTNFDSLDRTECRLAGNYLEGNYLCLGPDRQSSPSYDFTVEHSFGWIRPIADIKVEIKEWNVWQMTKFILRFHKGDQIVKECFIRPHRMLSNYEEQRVYFDVKKPEQPFDRVSVLFDHMNGDKRLGIDNLRVETYEEVEVSCFDY